MGKGDKRKTDQNDRGSTHDPRMERKQLWAINEVIINENYALKRQMMVKSITLCPQADKTCLQASGIRIGTHVPTFP